MLPSSHQEVYKNFLKALNTLQEAVNNSSEERVIAFATVEHLFQKVVTLTEEDIEPHLVSRWRLIQTELHRMYKLMATDWLFLRSSRQMATKQDRINVFCDRIEQMIKFCRILLEDSDRSQ